MDLQIPLSRLKGVGPSFAKRLEKLGLMTALDLIYHFPFRYDDYSKIIRISEAPIDQEVTIKGQVWNIQNSSSRYGKTLTRAILNDGSGSVELVWFNQAWLIKNILSGDTLHVSGKVDRRQNKLTMVSPTWEKIIENSIGLHTGRLVPVYPETFGVNSKWLRDKINSLLPLVLGSLVDPLPLEYKEAMFSLGKALQTIHFPRSFTEINLAKTRLGFDELLEIQLSTQKRRADWKQKQSAKGFKINESDLTTFTSSLPFELTHGQKTVLAEIIEDLQKPQAMNRLIQGEVGSGKTVVAAIAIYLSFRNHLRSLLMAPTEILAMQHYSSLKKLLEPLGMSVGLYTGSSKFNKQKSGVISQELLVKQEDSPNDSEARGPQPASTAKRGELIANSYPNVIVGTHALLSEKLLKENVGLVVIDEQQRFGVKQRTILRQQNNNLKNLAPHFLTMTATPIPRTVALTIYGDLDVSVIGELPKGRKPIKTHYVPSHKRLDAYAFMTKKIAGGDQVYLVTPLIEESETLVSAKAAKSEFEKLQAQIFPQFRLGILHGKLRPKEKEEVITRFKAGKIDLLVSTSVVEVGVDVPNATIMVIEGAERFGLAQLHQLRGRIGRG